jgi:hypothetical protein
MSNYDFRSLSPIDFEILVRDLLQEELKIRLESFKPGRDLGIDFRYSENSSRQVVVQCKHYADSTFSKLSSDMSRQELPKIVRLQPQRYILATSLGLSPKEKDHLLTSLGPYVKGTEDIFGKDDLNNLLQRFPAIERQHFKLWISSVPVLEEILHSKVKNVSRDELSKIKEHAKYYVQNDSFAEAIRILKASNLCIIAGIPGIGKTILAEMLLLHFVELRYEIVKITGDISEAAALDYRNEKRVFYYDDFLGQTSLSEKLNKNEDQRLFDFVEAIKRTKGSKLILTTREYILNQARLVYEKIARFSFRDETCVVELSKYTRMNRAKILYNHLYFSDAPAEYKKAIIHDRSYLKIIDHPNYNPRIVDLLTQRAHVRGVKARDYADFFVANLKNPSEVWRHAFENQLSPAARSILIALASLPSEIFVEDLHDAFLSLHTSLSNTYGFARTTMDFRRGLKELDDNFLRTKRSRERIIVAFHNPSVKDFVQNYLRASDSELLALVSAAFFFEQSRYLWAFDSEGEQEDNHQVLSRVIVNHADYFISSLQRTIDTRDCQLIARQAQDGSDYKTIWKTSHELRTCFVAEVATALRSSTSLELLESAIVKAEQRVRNGNATGKDVITLLQALKQIAYESPNRYKLLQSTKEMIMRNLFFLPGFEHFCKFMDEFPEAVTTADVESARAQLMELVDQEYQSDETDPDEIRQEAALLDNVAEVLDVDASATIQDLYVYADELEEEQSSNDQYEPDFDDDEYSGSYEPSSNDDIDSLFSTLDH